MAKILQGIGVEAISGTIGGTTFQKWKGLLIARGKPTPRNPMTDRQTRIRSIVSTISRAWRDVLNKGQRTAWKQHAEVFPWFDVFGRSIKLSGINLFLKINFILLDHDKIMQVTPPPTAEPLELTGITIDVHPEDLYLEIDQLTPGMITAEEPFVDVWVAGGFTEKIVTIDPDKYSLVIYSGCLPAGRTHQKSDFRHIHYADDFAVSDPAAQSVIQVRPPIEHTKNVVVRVQRYNKYGRYSVPVIYEGIRTGG